MSSITQWGTVMLAVLWRGRSWIPACSCCPTGLQSFMEELHIWQWDCKKGEFCREILTEQRFWERAARCIYSLEVTKSGLNQLQLQSNWKQGFKSCCAGILCLQHRCHINLQTAAQWHCSVCSISNPHQAGDRVGPSSHPTQFCQIFNSLLKISISPIKNTVGEGSCTFFGLL